MKIIQITDLHIYSKDEVVNGVELPAIYAFLTAISKSIDG